MVRCERVKIFTGANTTTLEKMYATWYDKILEQRDAAPITKGQPIIIRERNLVIRNYQGDETFALAVFYEDLVLADHEQGEDKGKHHKNGVSMVSPKRS